MKLPQGSCLAVANQRLPGRLVDPTRHTEIVLFLEVLDVRARYAPEVARDLDVVIIDLSQLDLQPAHGGIVLHSVVQRNDQLLPGLRSHTTSHGQPLGILEVLDSLLGERTEVPIVRPEVRESPIAQQILDRYDILVDISTGVDRPTGRRATAPLCCDRFLLG